MKDFDIDKFDLHISEKMNEGAREMLKSVKAVKNNKSKDEKEETEKKKDSNKKVVPRVEEHDER